MYVTRGSEFLGADQRPVALQELAWSSFDTVEAILSWDAYCSHSGGSRSTLSFGVLLHISPGPMAKYGVLWPSSIFCFWDRISIHCLRWQWTDIQLLWQFNQAALVHSSKALDNSWWRCGASSHLPSMRLYGISDHLWLHILRKPWGNWRRYKEEIKAI